MRALATLMLAATVASGPSAAMAQPAQPPAAPSVEAATLALARYKMHEDELPAGYAFAFSNALDNPGMTIEYVTGENEPPAPAEQILAVLVGSGRIVGIRELIEGPLDEERASIRFTATLFASPAAAAGALQEPSLVSFVFPGDQLDRFEAPPLGEGAAAYELKAVGGGDYLSLLLWRRGPVVFLLSACCEAGKVADVIPDMYDLGSRLDARYAGLPAPPPAGPTVVHTPPAARQLQLYQELGSRLVGDDAFAATGLHSVDVAAIANAMILNDVDTAAGIAADAGAMLQRLVTVEKRILGLTKKYEAAEDTSVPAGSRFPSLSLGYHLYADAAGASEALRAPLEELALRVSEEADLVEAKNIPMTEVAAPTGAPEGARAFRTRAEWEDGVVVDAFSVHWLRGNVELFVNLSVTPGAPSDELLREAIRAHDAAYTANPLAFADADIAQ